MKFKLLGTAILSSALLLTACGQSEDNSKKEHDKKSESKSDKKSNDPKKNKDTSKDKDKKKEDKEKSSNEENQNNQEQKSTESNNQKVDLSNIKDRSTLESVIYGNYSEEQKIQAYNSAVANSVIPQGNVMEGPASAAYESSLKVENGQEKSVYDNSNSSESTPGTDAGMIDYDEVDKQIEADRKAQEEKEAKLQKEYFDLSDKMFEEDVSDEEYEAMEKRQNEILDEVEPIN
ncbi:hypothetical protein [Staphylococcus sp. GDY8P57P]|uniref:hypothetical protein n=1 Tax=Staphylococcus sp. GDY8P57P TaxID=2804128 RepID=UPI001E45AA00|nr:hypothetical protein [Staphylococcus sp. GDY8P57P]